MVADEAVPFIKGDNANPTGLLALNWGGALCSAARRFSAASSLTLPFPSESPSLFFSMLSLLSPYSKETSSWLFRLSDCSSLIISASERPLRFFVFDDKPPASQLPSFRGCSNSLILPATDMGCASPRPEFANGFCEEPRGSVSLLL